MSGTLFPEGGMFYTLAGTIEVVMSARYEAVPTRVNKVREPTSFSLILENLRHSTGRE